MKKSLIITCYNMQIMQDIYPKELGRHTLAEVTAQPGTLEHAIDRLAHETSVAFVFAMDEAEAAALHPETPEPDNAEAANRALELMEQHLATSVLNGTPDLPSALARAQARHANLYRLVASYTQMPPEIGLEVVGARRLLTAVSSLVGRLYNEFHAPGVMEQTKK